MKTIQFGILLFCLVAVAACTTQRSYFDDSSISLAGSPNLKEVAIDTTYNPGDTTKVSYELFHEELGKYGSWVNDPKYGNVWVPGVDSTFQPYSSNGYWDYTNYGWTWQSSYAWGWAPFHYGRWFYDSPYGWAWVPGYQWSPAWVTWGSTADAFGWAPMFPNGYTWGLGFGIQFGGNYYPPSSYWSFVPRHKLVERNLGNYIVNRSYNNHFMPQTNILRNNTGRTFYSAGPSVHDLSGFNGNNAQRSYNTYRSQSNTNWGSTRSYNYGSFGNRGGGFRAGRGR